MKQSIYRYIVVAVFLIVTLLFGGFLLNSGMALSMEPVWGFLAFVLFLALFLAAAHGAGKLWEHLKTNKDKLL